MLIIGASLLDILNMVNRSCRRVFFGEFSSKAFSFVMNIWKHTDDISHGLPSKCLSKLNLFVFSQIIPSQQPFSELLPSIIQQPKTKQNCCRAAENIFSFSMPEEGSLLKSLGIYTVVEDKVEDRSRTNGELSDPCGFKRKWGMMLFYSHMLMMPLFIWELLFSANSFQEIAALLQALWHARILGPVLCSNKE